MTTTSWVSDEVWGQLEPGSARPTRRARRAIAAVVAVATFAAVVVAFGFISGLFRSQMWLETTDVTYIDRSAHAFTYNFRIHNPDWIDERLVAITSTDPNVRLRLSHPFTFRPDDWAYLTVRAQVLDCAHVRAYEPQLQLHLDRMWGELTKTVQADPLNPRTEQYADIFMTGAPYYVCH